MRILYKSIPFLSSSTSSSSSITIKHISVLQCTSPTVIQRQQQLLHQQQRYQYPNSIPPLSAVLYSSSSSSSSASSSSSSSSSTSQHQLYIQQINELELERKTLFGTSPTKSASNDDPNIQQEQKVISSDENNNDFMTFVSQQQQQQQDVEHDSTDHNNSYQNDDDVEMNNNNNNNNDDTMSPAEERELLVYGFTKEERNAWSTKTIVSNSTIPSNKTLRHEQEKQKQEEYAKLLRDIELARKEQLQQEQEQQQKLHRDTNRFLNVTQEQQHYPVSLPSDVSNADASNSLQKHNKQQFTHLSDDQRQVQMVDVGNKSITKRTAIAQSKVIFPPEVIEAFATTSASSSLSSKTSTSNTKVDEWMGPKGPIFATAITAGIMGVKQTSNLIPLCHPLAIEYIHIDIQWYNTNTIQITCTTSITSKTGVEMEAMMGCSIAALTIYDMVKAVSHNVQITDVQLQYKDGGKRHVDQR